MNNLDDEWINEFEKTDKLYKEFYKDDLYYSKGEYKLASDYPKGGFRRVKRRRRTQKKQRR